MLSFKSLSFALALLFSLACAARAQSPSVTASVAVNGQVSGTVLLNISPNAQLSAEETSVTSHKLDAHTILVSIETRGLHARQIAIPVQLRSNVGYALSASIKPRGATQTRIGGIRVTGARPTGALTAPDAVAAMNVAALTESSSFSSTATLLTGPRISLAGTPDSPHNALEVTILAEIVAHDREEMRSFELILSASPSSSSPALAQK